MRRARLAARRRELGLGQEQLAYALGHDPRTARRWELGHATPRPLHRKALADALHVDLAHLAEMLRGDVEHPFAPHAVGPADESDAPGPRAAVDPDADETARVLRALERPTRVDAQALRSLAGVLAELRRTEDLIGAAPLVAAVTGQLALMTRLITDARGPLRPRVADEAAQWAQFLAWLHTSIGDVDTAGRWWDRAAEWSAEADDRTLTANVLSFKGHVAWMRGQAGATIGLSVAAQRDPTVHVGQRAFDAFQEARGHAMAGDAHAAERKLEDGRHRAQAFADGDVEPSPWSYYYDESLFATEDGLVYLHLSLHEPAYAPAAVNRLGRGLGGITDARASEWVAERHHQLALAHMQNDEPVRACAAAADAAATARATGFERLLDALRRTQARLSARYPGQATVAELGVQLTEAPN